MLDKYENELMAVCRKVVSQYTVRTVEKKN